MRFAALCFILTTGTLALSGCHGKAPETSIKQPATSKPNEPQSSFITPPSSPPPAKPATLPQKAKQVRSTQEIAQLDLNSEGGVRDGSYAMWVHVTRLGKPEVNVAVVAFDRSNKIVAAARTNDDGDAMLKVQATTYRIATAKGHARAEQTVTFHPGDQFSLDLQ